jgi:L,D-transpeptidase ErfK/SrfK
MSSPYRIAVKIQVIALVLLTATIAHAKSFEGASIGKLENATVEKDERMMDISQKYEVGYAQLMAANPGVDPWLPRTGTKLTLPNWHLLPEAAHEGLVLNTAELRLYYFPADGSEPKTFPIGIGREGLNTPKGATTVTRKAKNPTWRPTPRMRLEDPELPAEVKTGPDNPLGGYALYLGWPSYLIHGTNKPKAIGRRASSGCIRMYDDHIEWIFKNVPVGSKVTSVNQPIKMAWIDGDLYLEAEPNDLQVDEIEYQNRQITIDVPNGALKSIRRKAGEDVGRVDWEIVRTALIHRSGIPVKITREKKDDEPLDKIAAKK